jgi:very-short-patch-repair endonuclease
MKELVWEEIRQLYEDEGKSFRVIAVEFETYPNKIKRFYERNGGVPRDKRDAQQIALKVGRSIHPTKGRERSEEERYNISKGQAEFWEHCDPEKIEKARQYAQAQWARMSEEDREALLASARDAARKTATEGSKLEIAIMTALARAGYQVEHQKDDILIDPRLRIDLFLPELSTAIEVDGLSHFAPIWGEENFRRNMLADQKKLGLLISLGIKVIRVKNTRNSLTLVMMRRTIDMVLQAVEQIENGTLEKKLIELEVT